MKDRSPSSPFIPLGTAVERLGALNAYTGRDPVLASRVGKAWGLAERSSQADSTLAALRSFGFVTYEGSGSGRAATITDDGRRLVRAQTEETKAEILKVAALRPKIIRKYWAAWGTARGADGACLDRLMDDGFSSTGARAFLKVYDDTIAYAKLSTADKVSSTEDNTEEEAEMETVSITRDPKGAPETTLRASRLYGAQGPRQAPAGMRNEIIGLIEGDVSLEYPAQLSPESYEELESALKLFLSRAKRRAEIERATVKKLAAELDKPEGEN